LLYFFLLKGKRAGDPEKLMLEVDPTSFAAHEVHGLEKALFAVVTHGSSSQVSKQ